MWHNNSKNLDNNKNIACGYAKLVTVFYIQHTPSSAGITTTHNTDTITPESPNLQNLQLPYFNFLQIP